MDVMTAIKTCFSKYVTFSGRARRSEFWWFFLFTMVGNMVLSIVDSTLFGTVTTMPGGFQASTNTPIFSGLFGLAVILPSISVAVRRLHDTDRSGWLYWLVLIPIIGWIILIVWYATQGTEGKNSYGDDPLSGAGGGHGGGDGGGYAESNIPDVGN